MSYVLVKELIKEQGINILLFYNLVNKEMIDNDVLQDKLKNALKDEGFSDNQMKLVDSFPDEFDIVNVKWEHNIDNIAESLVNKFDTMDDVEQFIKWGEYHEFLIRNNFIDYDVEIKVELSDVSIENKIYSIFEQEEFIKSYLEEAHSNVLDYQAYEIALEEGYNVEDMSLVKYDIDFDSRRTDFNTIFEMVEDRTHDDNVHDYIKSEQFIDDCFHSNALSYTVDLYGILADRKSVIKMIDNEVLNDELIKDVLTDVNISGQILEEKMNETVSLDEFSEEQISQIIKNPSYYNITNIRLLGESDDIADVILEDDEDIQSILGYIGTNVYYHELLTHNLLDFDVEITVEPYELDNE